MEVELEKAGRVDVPGTEMRMKVLGRAISSRCAEDGSPLSFFF